MHPLFTRSLDSIIIRLAANSMPASPRHQANASEAAALLDHPDFFCGSLPSPLDFVLTGKNHFIFQSAISTPWANNNCVHGKLFPSCADWKNHPTVILLHGWNDELGYRYRFPYLAGLLRRRQINTAIIELPYHLQRRPSGDGAVTDFISADLWRMVEATRQSIADTRSLAKWLRSQGCPKIGLWGASLGAWLGGLTICHDPEIDLAVLTTPVARLKSVINELAFCAPIRSSFEKTNLSLARIDLSSHRPKTALDRILIHEAEDDLFVSKEAVEAFWTDWEKPEIWRLRHGHISVLMSMPVMKRTVNWIAEKFSRDSTNLI